MSNKPQSWTAEAEQRLIALFRDYDDTALAQTFGRSKEAIRLRRVKLGLLRPPSNQHTRQEQTPAPPRERFDARHRVGVVCIEATLPAELVFGEKLTVDGKDVVFIAYNPDGDAVCWDKGGQQALIVGRG